MQRITGVAVFFFLLVHVLDTAPVRVSPDSYDRVIATYKTPIVSLLEVGLVAGCPLPRPERPTDHPGRLLVEGPRYQRQMLGESSWSGC